MMHLDHLVLTVRDLQATCDFYASVMGMEVVWFNDQTRVALHFGQQKFNLHEAGREIEPHALAPTPGSADLCFIIETPLDAFITHLHTLNVAIIDGPVTRTGATGPIRSVYFRDPDGNLIEVSTIIS